MGPDVFTESTFRKLCQCINSSYEPYVIEILSPRKICITYRHGVSLGQVAGELMVIESWEDLPILVTVVIIKRSKVDAIVEARQKYRKGQRDKELEDLGKSKQGRYDLQEEADQVAAQKETLKQKILDHDAKQHDLLKTVEQLTEKVTKLEMQPLHAQGFMTLSSQNVSTFGNLSMSFQVKAIIDIGNSVALNPLLLMNSTSISGVLMSNLIRPVTPITSYHQQSENQLLVRLNWS